MKKINNDIYIIYNFNTIGVKIGILQHIYEEIVRLTRQLTEVKFEHLYREEPYGSSNVKEWFTNWYGNLAWMGD